MEQHEKYTRSEGNPMLPLRRILCPTDFSDFSCQALQKAGELAAHFGAELIVLNVIEPIATPSYPTARSLQNLPEIERAARKGAEQELRSVLERTRFPGAVVRPLARTGNPAHGIVRAAKEENADLIVIPTHGLTGWRQYIFGSVTENVLRRAHCPVLLRRMNPAQHPGLPIPPRKIVCTTDWSEPSLHALQVAGEWAKHFGSELVVLHVVQPPTSPGIVMWHEQLAQAAQDEAMQGLHQVLQERLSQFVGARPIVRTGSPADAIAAAVEEEEADLLILATSGASIWREIVAGSPIERLMYGSVATNVLRLTSCPILTVRMPDAALETAQGRKSEPMNTPKDILEFWFGPEADPSHGQYRAVWFQPDEAFIKAARAQFSRTYQRAHDGELNDWQQTPEGALALVLLLDQFSNLLYRAEAGAFASDEAARAVTKRALEQGFDQQFPEIHRWFFYLPLEHSENLDDQHAAVDLFRALTPNETNALALDFAERHLRVIERFGRFPNRNAALGRRSTPEEEEFLAGPDAPF